MPGRAAWALLGAAGIVFHLGLIFSGLVPNLVSRPLHLMLALPWVMLYGTTGRWQRFSGALLSVAAAAACLWIVVSEAALADQYGMLAGPGQHLVAALLLLTVLEMARRAVGWPLPLVALLALGYGLFGRHVPGEFGYAGLPLASFLGTLTIAEGGLWGSLTGVSVGVVAVFVIFGAVLNAGEAGQGFMNLAAAAAGRLRGGAAKVSVLASALFGSISGSASANVASTGTVTLPAMMRLGYPPRLAAAVEAVASSGGQIMPPLMGAGAFVMVELTGVPYTEIVFAALLPALLYFLTVWVGINAYARRYRLRALDAAERPPARRVAVTALFFSAPFVTLLWLMFGGYTPQYAAAIAILVAALLLPFDAGLRVDARRTLARLEQACVTAGRQTGVIASVIVCAGIVVGVLGQTGLGIKITSLILSAAAGELWPALLLTALACLLLGMEVPTTAAYVICVSVAGPALQQLGLERLPVHLFVFWFALLSTITPPVCGAVFIAAAMAGVNWLPVALTAMTLGVGLYLIPLAMIADSALLAPFGQPAAAALAFVRIAAALAAVAYALIAPLPLWSRPLLLAIGAGLLSLGTRYGLT